MGSRDRGEKIRELLRKHRLLIFFLIVATLIGTVALVLSSLDMKNDRDLKDGHRDQEKKITSLENSLQQYQSKMQALETTIAGLQVQINALSGQNNALVQQSAFESTLDSFKERFEDFALSSQMTTTIDSLSNNIKDLQQRLKVQEERQYNATNLVTRNELSQYVAINSTLLDKMIMEDMEKDLDDLQEMLGISYYGAMNYMHDEESNTWTNNVQQNVGVAPWQNSNSKNLLWNVTDSGSCPGSNTEAGRPLFNNSEDGTKLQFCPCTSGLYRFSMEILSLNVSRDESSGTKTGSLFWGFVDSQDVQGFFSNDTPPIATYAWPPNVGSNVGSDNAWISISTTGIGLLRLEENKCYTFVQVVKDDLGIEDDDENMDYYISYTTQVTPNTRTYLTTQKIGMLTGVVNN